MLNDYRKAVAGSLITVIAWSVSEFAGVDIPGFVGAAAVTLAAFGIGYIPKSKDEKEAANA